MGAFTGEGGLLSGEENRLACELGVGSRSLGRGLLIGSFGDCPRAKGDLSGENARSAKRVVVAGVFGSLLGFFGDLSWLPLLSGMGPGDGRFVDTDFV